MMAKTWKMFQSWLSCISPGKCQLEDYKMPSDLSKPFQVLIKEWSVFKSLKLDDNLLVVGTSVLNISPFTTDW